MQLAEPTVHIFENGRLHRLRAHNWFYILRNHEFFARLPKQIFCGCLSGIVASVTNWLTFLGQSVFLVVAMCVPLAQQVQGKFLNSRTVYEVREHPARMFTWSAFLVSEILSEIPWNMLASSLIFFCWYWTSNFGSSRAGFSYLFYCIVFPLYYTTFGLAIMVISPNGVIASTVFSVLFSFLLILYVWLSPGMSSLVCTNGWGS